MVHGEESVISSSLGSSFCKLSGEAALILDQLFYFCWKIFTHHHPEGCVCCAPTELGLERNTHSFAKLGQSTQSKNYQTNKQTNEKLTYNNSYRIQNPSLLNILYYSKNKDGGKFLSDV